MQVNRPSAPRISKKPKFFLVRPVSCPRLFQLNIDDLVVGFEHRTEAEQFLEAFRERLAKFGLELHPDKTRLIEFGRFAIQNRKQRGQGKPETFTFLGFTHYCGKRRSNGTFIVRRKTVRKRMVAKLRAIYAELRRRMHEPIAEVGAWVKKVVAGYYRYHAVPGNLHAGFCLGRRDQGAMLTR